LVGDHRPEPETNPSEAEDETRDPRLLDEISATIDALETPSLLLDQEANVLFQNRASDRLLGALPMGVHVSARLRSPAVLDMVRETLANGRPNQIEHAERLPSQQVYMVRIAPIELKRSGNLGQLYLLCFRDISELRRLDQMRSDFVANASHELRTPLASLRGSPSGDGSSAMAWRMRSRLASITERR